MQNKSSLYIYYPHGIGDYLMAVDFFFALSQEYRVVVGLTHYVLGSRIQWSFHDSWGVNRPYRLKYKKSVSHDKKLFMHLAEMEGAKFIEVEFPYQSGHKRKYLATLFGFEPLAHVRKSLFDCRFPELGYKYDWFVHGLTSDLKKSKSAKFLLRYADASEAGVKVFDAGEYFKKAKSPSFLSCISKMRSASNLALCDSAFLHVADCLELPIRLHVTSKDIELRNAPVNSIREKIYTLPPVEYRLLGWINRNFNVLLSVFSYYTRKYDPIALFYIFLLKSGFLNRNQFICISGRDLNYRYLYWISMAAPNKRLGYEVGYKSMNLAKFPYVNEEQLSMLFVHYEF